MLNVISKPVLVAVGAVVCAGGLFYLADKNGYNRAIAKVNAETAKVIEKAKAQQAESQQAITQVVDQYYMAIEGRQALQDRLTQYKAQLRGQTDAPACENSDNGTVLPAIYRMYNAAADHPDLPEAVGARLPDAAGDGLDAIQFAVESRHAEAIKVNALQKLMRESGCFIIN